ncbi:MAG TPA: hypothetical protein VFX35_01385 [Solirubrobacterales bacterium]|nr:hypothetical protein [Solirubrobacterales bacterium]
MTETRNCLQCYQGWIEKGVLAAQEGGQRVEAHVHPLAEARAQQEQADLKSKLSQIIYQGIVDRLKFGTVHADDLEPLFPDELRTTCRRLVGAQFGSLASRGYIVERERRKSKVPSRKGAKSGVFECTKKGRETLVGNSAGEIVSSPGGTCAVSGESIPGGRDQARNPMGGPVDAASGEPARLFDDGAPSAYDRMQDAA